MFNQLVVKGIFCFCLAFLFSTLSVSFVCAAEPWGNDPGHNHVRDAKNLPGELTSATTLWRYDSLTKHQYPMPTIVGDKCLIYGDAAGNPDPFYRAGAAMTCRDLRDGTEIWRLMVPPKGGGRNAFGICGVPVVEDNRIYVLANFDIVCVDLNGLSDGNDGMKNELEFLRERQRGNKSDFPEELPEGLADIIWVYDLVPLGVQVQDSSSCSVIKVGNQIWVSTAHEIGSESRVYDPQQDPPHIVVMDAETGEMIARDDMNVPIVFHGEWSSPSAITVNGETAVLFGDGYGILHAFKIPEPSDDGEPVILEEYWQMDLNLPENRVNDDGQRIVYTLDLRIKYKYPKDYFVNTEKYYHFGWDPGVDDDENLKKVGQPYGNMAKGQEAEVLGPSEIISMPAVVDNRIYIGIGRDRAYGLDKGKGRFLCLEVEDVKKQPAIRWEDREVGRTQSTASIVDGLCYVADGFSNLNCWDADTGELVYRYDLEDSRGIRERSQMVADGKIFIANDRKQMKVIKAGREPILLGETRIKADAATVEAVDGLVLVVTHRDVTLYGKKEYLPE
jgi:outer membrane protein assembly factor BamB